MGIGRGNLLALGIYFQVTENIAILTWEEADPAEVIIMWKWNFHNCSPSRQSRDISCTGNGCSVRCEKRK